MKQEQKQQTITRAAELAYEEDCTQVVGLDETGTWVIRSWEDPTSSQLTDAVKVSADGPEED